MTYNSYCISNIRIALSNFVLLIDAVFLTDECKFMGKESKGKWLVEGQTLPSDTHVNLNEVDGICMCVLRAHFGSVMHPHPCSHSWYMLPTGME